MEQLVVDAPGVVDLQHREGVEEHHAKVPFAQADHRGRPRDLTGEDLEHLLAVPAAGRPDPGAAGPILLTSETGGASCSFRREDCVLPTF